jgi:hypothetical protein
MVRLNVCPSVFRIANCPAYVVTISTHEDPFSALTAEKFVSQLSVSTASFYAAARYFTQLPRSTHPKAFIYTGNASPGLIVPAVMDLGVGKTAAAYIIETAANTYGKSGGEKGFWYFADQRSPSGLSVIGDGLSGDAHAKYFWELVNTKSQGPWNATFVAGKGYVDFESKRDRPSRTWEELLKLMQEQGAE